jgi:NodT family efflux transporter outer membrane factor (OMF) lipoprotein
VGQDVPARWWEAYGSPPLNALMDQALAASPDVQSAQAALRSAHELYLAQRGALLPTADAGYSLSRQKLSREISPTLNNNADLFTLHTVQVNVGYTPDVFGGFRRQVENAQAQAEDLRFQAEAAYLTLTANVVAAAIQQASLAAQIKDAEALVAADRRSLEVMRKSLRLGEIAEPDVAAQEVAAAQAEQGLPTLRKALAQQNDLLAFLTGRTPGEAPIPMLDLASLTLPAELPVSLPSILVRHRPDIRAAEANLHAASAAVGVAIAARLPTFPLTASAGGQATDVGALFSGPNSFWTLTGAAAAPIFEGGQLLHKQRSAEALLDQAKAQYRGVVLGAFQNVADSLEALRGDGDALDAALAVDQSTARALASAQKQMRYGEGASLPVLAAEQARLQARSALTQAQAARLTDTAALFQALGGGWWNRGDFAEASPGAAASASTRR